MTYLSKYSLDLPPPCQWRAGTAAVVTIVALLSIVSAADAQVYKQVGPDGTVIYSDKPSQGGKKLSTNQGTTKSGNPGAPKTSSPPQTSSGPAVTAEDEDRSADRPTSSSRSGGGAGGGGGGGGEGGAGGAGGRGGGAGGSTSAAADKPAAGPAPGAPDPAPKPSSTSAQPSPSAAPTGGGKTGGGQNPGGAPQAASQGSGAPQTSAAAASQAGGQTNASAPPAVPPPPKPKPAACAPKPVPASVSLASWTPGHYLRVYPNSPEWQIRAWMTKSSRFAGIVRTYYWKDLEPQPGQYNFSAISKDLQFVSRLNKKLIVEIEVRAYFKGRSNVPGYVPELFPGSTLIEQKLKATHPVLWHSDVADRMICLYTELGDRFSNAPGLEALVTTETSYDWGTIKSLPASIPRYSDNAYLASLKRQYAALRGAFPTTNVVAFVNYPEAILPGLAAYLPTVGIGLGGPDLYLEDSFLINGVYRLYPTLAGQVPLLASVQWDNYGRRRPGAPYEVIPLQELYDFAKTDLQVNYMLWDVRQDPIDFLQNVVDFVNQLPPVTPSDLAFVCPTKTRPCAPSQ